MRGIHWRPVNSPHKGPVTGKMSPFHDAIMFLCVFKSLRPGKGFSFQKHCFGFYFYIKTSRFIQYIHLGVPQQQQVQSYVLISWWQWRNWRFLDIFYTPRFNEVEGGYTGFTLSVHLSVCPSVQPSICLSVDRIVSALYLQQYSSDPFHVCTYHQATSESVFCIMFVSKLENLKFWRIL